jgi:hypothetical protein
MATHPLNGVNSDDENSGEALDGDTSIGRVYRGQNRDARQWSMYAVRPRLDLNFARWGEAASKKEGKQRVEEAYAELLRRAGAHGRENSAGDCD